MAEVASAYVTLVPSAQGFGRTLESQVGGQVGRSGRRFGGILGGGMAAGLARAAAPIAAVAGLGAVLNAGFKRLNAIDQAKAKLSGLGNSTKTVNAIMKNALASVKGTAFGLDEAATTAAGAVAAGIKPGKQLEGVLKTVADTATIAGKSMADTGAIFGSVAARGKLQGDDLMQLQSAGVPVLAFLAKHYGITAAAASKMVSKGKVDFKNFAAAMQENIGGAALKSGETFTGAWANFKASLGRIGANLLSGLFEPLKGAIGKMTGFLSSTLEPLATKIGGWIGKGVAQIGPALGKIGGFLKPVTDTVKLFIGTLTGKGADVDLPWMNTVIDAAGTVSQVFTQVVDTVKLFIGTLTGQGADVGDLPWMNQVIDAGAAVSNLFTGQILPAVQGAIAQIGPILQQVGGFITGSVLPALQSFGSYVLTTIVPTLLRFWEIIATNVLPILASFGQFIISTIVPAVVQVATSIATHLQPILASLVEVFQARILPTLQNVLSKFREWQPTIQAVIAVVVQIIAKVLEFAAAVLGKVLPVLIRFAGFLLENAVGAVVAVIGVIVKIIAKVIAFGSAVVDAVKDVAKFLSAVKEKFGEALDFIGEIPGKIKGFFSDAGSWLLNAGKEIIGGLLSGITEKFEDVKHFVGGIGSWIKDHKGPLSYDRRLLVPAGKAIMGGFNDSLRSGMGDLRSTVDGITGALNIAPASLSGLSTAGGAGSAQQLVVNIDGQKLFEIMVGRTKQNVKRTGVNALVST